MTTVSIVIPVYNAEKYIMECVESALSQSFKDIEIIAIDDGSSDRSLEILKKFADKIKIISKENGGTSSALNAGIKIMTGDWFKWLSADDVLYPNAIEELILESNKVKNKENCIFYSSYDIIDSYGKIIKHFIEPNYNSLISFDLNVILLDHHIGNGTTSLISKSAIDQFGKFDEHIGFAEDYELWLRYCLLHNCRLHLVPKILAKYRVHETQLSKEKILTAFENREKIKKLVLSKMEQSKREKYKIALNQFRKKEELSVRSRHIIRDLILRILPKTASKKIIKKYFEFKKE
jgi:glycosyltransferase involved in cell wall biosynthesis